MSRGLPLTLVLLAACTGGLELPPEVVSAEPWPRADLLFRSDPRWLGGDGAYSIDLGRERVLWLFGDSFIATSARGVRSESRLIRNSVALQEGLDPSTAQLSFHWREDGDGPASFFDEEGERWFWPAHGARLGDVLILFLSGQRAGPSALGFEHDGWKVVAVTNPDDPPSEWVLSSPALPPAAERLIVGAAVAREGDHLRVYAPSGDGDHEVHLFDWPVDAAAALETSRLARRSEGPVFSPGATELSVHADPILGRWISIQTVGFGPAELALRTSPSAGGPWSALAAFYRPPESDRDDILVYAGKAHPWLRGAELVATYSTNSLDFEALVADTSLYYPRFVKLDLGPAE